MILVKLFSGRFVFKNEASLRPSRRGDNVGFFRRRCRTATGNHHWQSLFIKPTRPCCVGFWFVI
jgi:hypothetical protein